MSPSPAFAADAFGRGYLRVISALAAFLMGLILVVTSTQVFYRYFLNDSLVWAEEGCRSLMIWMCFLFAGPAFQRGEMIAIHMATSLLSPRGRALIVVPGYLVASAFLAAMVYYGWIYAKQNLDQTMPGLEVLWQSLTGLDSIFPIFWVYLAVPVGCAILCIHMLISAIKITTEAIAGPAERN